MLLFLLLIRKVQSLSNTFFEWSHGFFSMSVDIKQARWKTPPGKTLGWRRLHSQPASL